MRRYVGFDQDNTRWEGFDFREGDIVVSAPMKAGTTWTQTICLLLVHGTSAWPGTLDELSPWLDMETRPVDDVRAVLEAQTHRRVIKTHTPLDGVPQVGGVTYIGVGRHPLDLVLSAAAHSANMDFDRTFGLIATTVGDDEALRRLADRPVPSSDPAERLEFYLHADHPPEVALTLAGVMAHYRTYFEATRDAEVLQVHYGDLTLDLPGEMRRIAAGIGIEVGSDDWPPLVEAASFDAMRRAGDRVVPCAALGVFRDPSAFFARAGHGQWRDEVAPEMIAVFDERMKELDPHGTLASWAVQGTQESR